jgi:hypothetical protein
MEFLVVRFDTSRRVLVNGNPFGLTNTLIQIDAGTHRIALAPPADFAPTAQTVLVKNTSPLAPLTVSFRLAAAAPASTAAAAPAPSPPAAPKPAAPAPKPSA